MAKRKVDYTMDNTNMSFTVEKRLEGSYRTKRILMIALVVFLYLLPFSLFLILSNLSWIIFIIVPVWIGFMAKGLQPFLMCWVKISNIYEVKDLGIVTAYKRFGGRKPIEITTTRIKDWTIIAPLTEEKLAEIKSCKKVYRVTHSDEIIGEFDYYALYTNEAGESCAFVFEVPDKMAGICKFYNRANFVEKANA